MKPISVLLCSGVLAVTGCQTSQVNQTKEKLDIQGHRGARAVRPENTLPAFQYALEWGVDTLELDTVVTKDDVVVLHHDLVLNSMICRTEKGKKISDGILIRSLTLAQVKKYDCGSVVNPRFPKQKIVPGTRLPTLDEVFELVSKSKLPAAKTVRLNIETKSDPTKKKAQPAPEKFVSLILEVARKYHMENRIIIQSFDHRTLIAAKKQALHVPRAALFEERPSDVVTAVARAEGTIFSPNHEWLVEEDVERLQAIGVSVIPWTANTEEAWRRLINMQVNGIITDDPAALMEFLKN